MPYNDKHIKIDASKRELNKKIKNLITEVNDEIYWYIRFNLPLDEQSVNSKNMKVTDVKGAIFKTNIIYNKELELIIISPLEKFKKDEYYILHISKKVKSENKQNIKKTVHILFKIKDGELVDFNELGENVKVPRPRLVPKIIKNIDTKSRVYNFDQKQKQKLEKAKESDKLPYLTLKLNPIIALLGATCFFIGAFIKIFSLAALGIVLSIAGFTVIVMQMRQTQFRSSLNYNLGVLAFNRQKYIKASRNFQKAVSLNEKNELAEYALNKVSFYI